MQSMRSHYGVLLMLTGIALIIGMVIGSLCAFQVSSATEAGLTTVGRHWRLLLLGFVVPFLWSWFSAAAMVLVSRPLILSPFRWLRVAALIVAMGVGISAMKGAMQYGSGFLEPVTRIPDWLVVGAGFGGWFVETGLFACAAVCILEICVAAAWSWWRRKVPRDSSR